MPTMNSEVHALKRQTMAGMRDYMALVLKAGNDPGYSEIEIQKCESIIDTCIQNVSDSAMGDESAVMTAVKCAVLALNELNAETGETLIETDQREDICALFSIAAKSLGVGVGEKDITEQWREW